MEGAYQAKANRIQTDIKRIRSPASAKKDKVQRMTKIEMQTTGTSPNVRWSVYHRHALLTQNFPGSGSKLNNAAIEENKQVLVEALPLA